MRVTREVQAQTRSRILEAARMQFRTRGFAEATTRDIAREAGVATGTLFNYFPTKEAIAMTLVAEALQEARADAAGRAEAGRSLEEDLFAQVAAKLRRLKPHRGYVRPVLETSLTPLSESPPPELTEALRVAHLERVNEIMAAHGIEDPPAMAWQLYWTLYTGLLAYWAGDRSPMQEDTLALLDQSMRMYVQWLRSTSAARS